ncbi:MAG: DUF4861 domain-containing protein [Paludibacter sp.]|nr:DUF4861 domain-containing protein [Paludibacter sp.]
MKTKLIISALILSTAILSAENINLKVSNPNKAELKNAPVVVTLDKYKEIPAAKRADLAVYVNGKQISSELDDLNKDGIPDELVFLLNLKAGQTQQVTLKTIKASERENFPTEVYADLISKTKDGKWDFVKEMSSTKNDMYNKMHHHGVAFESDLMAYRVYFDNKSTIDVYAKKKQQLELATTEWYPTDEQAAAGYGDDVIRVFNTVGVGTVKGWNGTKATHIDKFDKRTQRIVAAGKLRTVVECEVDGWQYEGKKINMTVRYILYARHRDGICEVHASEDIANLATGVQTIAGGPTMTNIKGLVGSWGTDYPVTDTVKYEKQTCGLGVYVPKQFVKNQLTEGQNNLILMPYHKGETLRFYFTAAALKEELKPFTTSDQFFAYLKKWIRELEPVVLK